jgi:hypothetical protein
MIRRYLALLLIGCVVLTMLPSALQAQVPPEPTPILGEPTVVTPVVTAPPSDGVSPLPTLPEVPAAPALTPTATTSTATDALPDVCEPNDARAAACALEIDAVNGPFSFVPAGDVDWYRVELAESGLDTQITVRGTRDLDLLTTLSRDDGTPLTTIASPAISTTLTTDITGGVLLRVENRAPGASAAQRYNIEIRRVLPPSPVLAEEPVILLPDALEDNWSSATAAPIAVGVVYDLNFVCPVDWGCPGGDHDYLRLPVKAGVPYLIATFDLGPGVDTVLDLFWGDDPQPLLTNDDARPGSSFLSVLRWVAPADGDAIIRVAPRTGGHTAIVADDAAGIYRFAVALAASDLATQLEERLADQTNAPTPTPRPAAPPPQAAAPAAAPPPAPTSLPVSSDAPTGTAVVRTATTALREGPSAAAPAIQTLNGETQVTLLGQSSGAWVRVQPADGVVPGWVWGPDLAFLPEGTPTTAATASISPIAGVENASSEGTATPATNSAPATRQTLRVETLDPLPAPAPPLSPQRITVTVTVAVVQSDGSSSAGQPTTTPTAQPPLAGVRIHLVNAFGDVLAEAVTPASGQVTLTTAILPATALFIRVPAMGVVVPVDPAQPDIRIVLPISEEVAS